LLLFSLLIPNQAFSAECRTDCASVEECERFINECAQVIAPFTQANLANKQTLADFERQVKSLEQMIVSAAKQIAVFEEKITEEEADLAVQKILLAEKVKRFYIFSRQNNTLTIFFADKSNAYLLKNIFYQQMLAEKDKKAIADLSLRLAALKKDQENLKSRKEWLAQSRKNFAEKAAFFKKEVEKTEKYIGELSSTIKTLTAKQQKLIEEKTGLFSTSVGDTPGVDDPCSGPPGSANFCSPGFAPAFAAFSFGAPHRKGMSQYGAFGRAKSGQNYETILKAYYGNIRIETIDPPANINTSAGSLPFENNYLNGIAEMPSSWGDQGGFEALKAQAIAARTYALSYVNWRMGSRNVSGNICTSEACQVYKSSKAANTPELWRKAVEETKGKIVVSNSTNEIISAWYASTSGGYNYSYGTLGHNTSGGWDTTCGNQGCWPNDAYEKTSNSPWFYKGWYKTRGGTACGRSNPWLNSEEFADIINAVLVYSKDNGTVSHLSQTDSCLANIPDTWSKDQLKNEAAKFGGPISSVNNVSVEYSSAGYTQNVKVSTDKGEFTFSGEDFKQIFNLRAPGAIHLKSLLFNVVKI